MTAADAGVDRAPLELIPLGGLGEFGMNMMVVAYGDEAILIDAGVMFPEPDLLGAALERGYYVSFAGNVTFPKAHALRDAAARVASDRILAETDSPYLAPQPVRGQPNEPRYVLHTLATLAAARVEDPHELERRIDENATAAFGLGAP